MKGRTFIIALVAGVAGLVGGFLLASSINRNEISSLRSENELLKRDRKSLKDPSATELSDDEIRSTIQLADAAPNNFQTQRNVGVAVYRYAASKQDIGLLRTSVRILERASDLRADDADVNLTLANAHFDVGYFGKDNESFAKARPLYVKVLAARPSNVDVMADLGLSYFLQSPPDDESAAREFRKALNLDPGHEKSLQFLIQALIRQNKKAEASQYLDQLRAAYPESPAVNELTSMLATTPSSQ